MFIINKIMQRKERIMNWKTVNIHLAKGSILVVYRDSALIFR